MTHPLHLLRKPLGISRLCLVFQGTPRPYWEDGVAFHHLHYAPAPLMCGHEGLSQADGDFRVALEFEVGRHTGLPKFWPGETHLLPYRAPHERLTLSMPMTESTTPERLGVLDEAGRLLMHLAMLGRTAPMITVSHQVCVGRASILRHHLVAILTNSHKALWVHPAAHALGLVQISFPEAQEFRRLGSIPSWVETIDPAMLALDGSGFPQWFPFARAVSGLPPMGTWPRALAGWDPAFSPEASRSSAEAYLEAFESFFGCGEVMYHREPREGS